MKVQDISDIFEHNLAEVNKADLAPARFMDYENNGLWDLSYQGQMDSLPGIEEVLNIFNKELYDLYGRLCAVHGEEKVRAYESCVVLSKKITEQFAAAMVQLKAWKSEETGFWKRQQLRLSQSVREQEEKKTKEQVRQILKLPKCYSAYLAMTFAGDEFNQMIKEYQIKLVSYTDYLDVVCPCPVPGMDRRPILRLDRSKIIPSIDAYAAAQLLGGAGFTGELVRRAKLTEEFKQYGIETPFTFI